MASPPDWSAPYGQGGGVGRPIVALVGALVLVAALLLQRVTALLIERGQYGSVTLWMDRLFSPFSGFVEFDIPQVGFATVTGLVLTVAACVTALLIVLGKPAWRAVAFVTGGLVLLHQVALAVRAGGSIGWDTVLALLIPTVGAVLLLVGAAMAGGSSAGRARGPARAELLAMAAQPVTSPKPPQQVANELLSSLAMTGCVVTSVTPEVITGLRTERGRVNWLIAVLWWFLCVVPMVIYIVNASKDRTAPFTLLLAPAGPGTVVQVNARDDTLLAVRAVVDRVA